MAETRRELFKLSIISALGVMAIPSAVRAGKVKQAGRALLHLSDGTDALVVKTGKDLVAYDVTSLKIKTGADLSVIDLTKYYKLKDYTTYQIVTSDGQKYPLTTTTHGAVKDADGVGNLTANAWCEVYNKRVKSGTGN